MKVTIEIEGINDIQRSIDALERAITKTNLSAYTKDLLLDTKYILIAIKEEAKREKSNEMGNR